MKAKSITKIIFSLLTASIATLAISCQPVAAKTDFSDGEYAEYMEKYMETHSPTISNAVNGKYYPTAGIVTSVTSKSDSTDIVTFICSNGNIFSFTAPATDCWEEEDIVSCIMDNNGTSKVHDDVIVSALYVGSTRQLEQEYNSNKGELIK